MPDQKPGTVGTERGTLEIVCREALQKIGNELRQLEPAGLGYALLVFDVGAGGNLAYVSNARRDDIARAMQLTSVFDQERPT